MHKAETLDLRYKLILIKVYASGPADETENFSILFDGNKRFLM